MDSQSEDYIQLASDFRLDQMVAVAATAFVTYDIIITSVQEVEVVWRSRWSVPKVLYFCVRCFGLTSLSTFLIQGFVRQPPLISTYCEYVITIVTPIQSLVSFCVDLMLLLRLRAVYKDHRAMALLLYIPFAVYISLLICGSTLAAFGDFGAPSPLSVGCMLAHWGPYNKLGLILAFTAPALFAGWLFALTLIKLLPYLSKGSIASEILSVFVRDGGLYCGLIFSGALFTMLWEGFIPGTFRSGLYGLVAPWLIAIQTVTASRLFLNLRAAAHPPLYSSTRPELEDGVDSDERCNNIDDSSPDICDDGKI